MSKSKPKDNTPDQFCIFGSGGSLPTIIQTQQQQAIPPVLSEAGQCAVQTPKYTLPLGAYFLALFAKKEQASGPEKEKIKHLFLQIAKEIKDLIASLIRQYPANERLGLQRRYQDLCQNVSRALRKSLENNTAELSDYELLSEQEKDLFRELATISGIIEDKRADLLGKILAEAQANLQKSKTEPTEASGDKSGENMQPTSETTKGKAETIREQVFIVYSHKDKGWLEDLQTHLKPYMRNRTLTAWSDENISPGAEWFEEIKRALASTKVAVLLVTKDFLASEFIHERELTPLLKEAEKGNVCIIWIPVRACAYNETPLKNYQAAIGPDKPLANMKKADRDKAWVTICEKIKKAGSR